MPHMLPPETSSPKRPNKQLLSLLQEMAYEETAGDEVEDLLALLAFAKQLHPEIEAVSSGAIASDYQRLRVEHVRDPCSFLPHCSAWRKLEFCTSQPACSDHSPLSMQGAWADSSCGRSCSASSVAVELTVAPACLPTCVQALCSAPRCFSDCCAPDGCTCLPGRCVIVWAWCPWPTCGTSPSSCSCSP